MLGREQIEIKTPAQVRRMRTAGLVVADIHQALRQAVRAGITTAELDAVSARTIERAGAHSNFLGYHDYPATVCISVNDEVVHGIPGPRVLQDGDLVTFDCGAYVTDPDGTQWHGDAAFTTVVGGTYRNDSDRVLDTTTQRALWEAIAAVARAATETGKGRATTARATPWRPPTPWPTSSTSSTAWPWRRASTWLPCWPRCSARTCPSWGLTAGRSTARTARSSRGPATSPRMWPGC